MSFASLWTLNCWSACCCRRRGTTPPLLGGILLDLLATHEVNVQDLELSFAIIGILYDIISVELARLHLLDYLVVFILHHLSFLLVLH